METFIVNSREYNITTMNTEIVKTYDEYGVSAEVIYEMCSTIQGINLIIARITNLITDNNTDICIGIAKDIDDFDDKVEKYDMIKFLTKKQTK